MDKKHLLPSAPPLTRFTEMNTPIIRRKLIEFTLTDNTVKDKIAASTISKLCIRLNTLQVNALQHSVGYAIIDFSHFNAVCYRFTLIEVFI